MYKEEVLISRHGPTINPYCIMKAIQRQVCINMLKDAAGVDTQDSTIR